jgi:hypothetical protein
LRRELRSADRFSDAAIRFGSRNVNTPRFRSSASRPCVTRCDQRFGEVLRFAAGFLRAEPALRLAVLGCLAAVLRERVAIIDLHSLLAKTGVNSIGSSQSPDGTWQACGR